jgi:hypothetical protein
VSETGQLSVLKESQTRNGDFDLNPPLLEYEDMLAPATDLDKLVGPWNTGIEKSNVRTRFLTNG